ncbi:MAG: hypothetical protein KC910_15830 [Candidatus Eremiobacteraeota bacterium]|nr:hypothetical protein [Candidatus Eremiobacteraeota bacterium]
MKNLISLVLGGLLLGGLMFGCGGGGGTPPADTNTPAVSTPAEGDTMQATPEAGAETPMGEETPMSEGEGDSH